MGLFPRLSLESHRSRGSVGRRRPRVPRRQGRQASTAVATVADLADATSRIATGRLVAVVPSRAVLRAEVVAVHCCAPGTGLSSGMGMLLGSSSMHCPRCLSNGSLVVMAAQVVYTAPEGVRELGPLSRVVLEHITLSAPITRGRGRGDVAVIGAVTARSSAGARVSVIAGSSVCRISCSTLCGSVIAIG